MGAKEILDLQNSDTYFSTLSNEDKEYIISIMSIYSETYSASFTPNSTWFGEIKFCPKCKGTRMTNCSSCGCGNCLTCNYSFVCIPNDWLPKTDFVLKIE